MKLKKKIDDEDLSKLYHGKFDSNMRYVYIYAEYALQQQEHLFTASKTSL